MFESEKGFLERIAAKIPGIKGYADKESRRDTDKRLREFMASEVDRHRRALDAVKRDLLEKGKLDLLDDADRAVRKLQKSADSLRFATYGYAGFFDQVKVREEELDKLYEYDTQLLALVHGIEPAVAAVGSAAEAAPAIRALEGAADALIEAIERRKQIFNTPA